MGLYTVIGFLGLVSAFMVYDENIRMRGFHLGLCGAFKVQTMGAGHTPGAALAEINALFPDVSLDAKLRVAVPLGVNEKTTAGEKGLWLDPCEGTRYGCETTGRPVMLFVIEGAERAAYTGPAALLARTANASVLICSVEDVAVCVKEVSGKAVEGRFVGVGVGGGADALAGVASEAKALWLIEPVSPVGAGAGAVLISTTSASKASAAPASAQTDLAQSLDSTSLPIAFPLLAEWLPQGKTSLDTAKAFFLKALA